jgi:hypothetical protein
MSAYLRLPRQKLSRANALLAADKTTYVGVGIRVPKPLNLLPAALLLLFCCFTATLLLLYCYGTIDLLLLYFCTAGLQENSCRRRHPCAQAPYLSCRGCNARAY